jgi:hypothetical protein
VRISCIVHQCATPTAADLGTAFRIISRRSTSQRGIHPSFRMRMSASRIHTSQYTPHQGCCSCLRGDRHSAILGSSRRALMSMCSIRNADSRSKAPLNRRRLPSLLSAPPLITALVPVAPLKIMDMTMFSKSLEDVESAPPRSGAHTLAWRGVGVRVPQKGSKHHKALLQGISGVAHAGTFPARPLARLVLSSRCRRARRTHGPVRLRKNDGIYAHATRIMLRLFRA